MAREEMKTNANIGSSSLILIFIVMCLATFGLLSLSSAKSDWKLAEKNARAVELYYKADSLGEEFLDKVDGIMIESLAGNPDIEVCKDNLKREFGDAYREETGIITAEIPMESGQALLIELELSCNTNNRYNIEKWQVVNLVDYEIDDSMPIWDGQ